ncbi:ATPase AAA [Longispora fulva]|uniref:MoxR-like ATPase n=1 Tax=Longispora fulva TaxID=619741 RepID=A0A8J7KKB7_9ACTN|nr:MoxR family ATPase [Longispora fulva]MBG6136491.1 MoxR-like ATPase [Longispora fulva]GIG59661.1 ATPase AAA [Longispora fulva]
MNKDWWIYTGTRQPHDGIARLPEPPPWRAFASEEDTPFDRDGPTGPHNRLKPAAAYEADNHTIDMVNTALYLRRPLLVTGDPGVGKSMLAYAVARELRLGSVLRWPVTSQSTLQQGLYRYDAIGRVGDSNLSGQAGEISRYLRLGPLGTALAPFRLPRVLLVDEIDKSDIDLPNDLLDVFEEGEYEIPELSRLAEDEVRIRPADEGQPVLVRHGRLRCRAFPLVVLTSNGERAFPPAFLRRCVQLDLPAPGAERLSAIVAAHLGTAEVGRSAELIDTFLARRELGDLATDQLLNAVYLAGATGVSRAHLAELVMKNLNPTI